MHIIEHDEIDLRLDIVGRREAATGVVDLEMSDPGGGDLPRWTPGAHIDLKLTSGLTRQYSLCGDPENRSVWRIGVLLEPESRGGSRFVHEQLEQGCQVDVRGPRNNFVLEPAASYVFIAGGIGITPLMPMVRAAAGADWELHYGGRSLDTMAFRDELTAHQHANGRVHLYPQDTTGILDLPSILGEPRDDVLVYCCGPEPLIKAVEQYCSDWPQGALRIERFSAAAQGAPARADTFEVVLEKSGLTLSVPPERSILEVVTDAGVVVDSSCAEGICGTCETAVLAGQVDHRDSLLSDNEKAANDVMFVCVSRAVSPSITLDL